MMNADHERVEIASRPQLRRWFAKHHAQQESVWVVIWKKGHLGHVAYDDIVEECLCFGWIDSQPRSLDASRSMLRLSPRRATSAWSKKNKERVERLVAAKQMTRWGIARVEEAKRNGKWVHLDEVEALVVPRDLSAAFRAHPGAAREWKGFPRSVRRGILEWIAAARKPETRGKRVSETAAKAAQGIRANQWR